MLVLNMGQAFRYFSHYAFGFEVQPNLHPNPYALHPFRLLVGELDNLRDYAVESSFIARNIQHYRVAGF